MDTSLVYLAVGFSGILLLSYAALLFWSPPPIITHESEKNYRWSGGGGGGGESPQKPTYRPLTKISEPATHDLTVVVPAYNETERLPSMLASTIEHLTSPPPPSIVRRSFEILIVDDGSTDGTCDSALELARKYEGCDIKIVRLEKNLGKGGAVRHGMLYAGGRRLLMADADGASRIEDLEKLWEAMDEIAPGEAPGVVVGSRAHLVKSDAVVKRSVLRNILMYGFHTILRVFGVGYIRDTQCGFKLFTRSAAQELFPLQRLPSWIFDVELLLLARRLGIPVAEVSVDWHEVPGSKLNVLSASVEMFRDLLVVRANHLLGRWRTTVKVKVKVD